MTIEITKYLSTELNPLSLPPFSVMRIDLEDNVTEFRSPSRLSQFLFYDSFFERRWAISVPAMTSAEKTTLETFWKNQQGRAIPFSWADDEENGYFVRFDSQLSFQAIKKGYWSVSFQLREAHPMEIDIVEEGGGE